MTKKRSYHRNNIPCKTCLIYPVCCNKVKETENLDCSILYYWRLNYKGTDDRFWKSIDRVFPGHILINTIV